MLVPLGRLAQKFVRTGNCLPFGYALSRTILALATLGTLATNTTTILFPTRSSACVQEEAMSIFCIVPAGSLDLVRWGCVIVLGFVATGMLPRLTGLLHWWITHSLAVSGRIVDGGDALAANITLLLLPVTLVDGRKWHWQKPMWPTASGSGEVVRRLVALSCLAAVKVQVVLVYAEAAYGKIRQSEWRDGTALYYWLFDSFYGLPGYLRPAAVPLLKSYYVVALLTWGVIVMELFLAGAPFMGRTVGLTALVAGTMMHLFIAFAFGLPSFSLIMAAALVVCFWPAKDWESGFSIDGNPVRALAIGKPADEMEAKAAL